jgi:hypothetical protein
MPMRVCARDEHYLGTSETAVLSETLQAGEDVLAAAEWRQVTWR